MVHMDEMKKSNKSQQIQQIPPSSFHSLHITIYKRLFPPTPPLGILLFFCQIGYLSPFFQHTHTQKHEKTRKKLIFSIIFGII